MRGWGESAGVYYKHDSPEQGREQVQQIADRIAAGMDRAELLEALPAGGARNAIDCALWDLEAKRRGVPVWELAGLRKHPHRFSRRIRLAPMRPKQWPPARAIFAAHER